MTSEDFVEVKAVCIECGKEVKIVSFGEPDVSDYLCQQCSSEQFAGIRDG